MLPGRIKLRRRGWYGQGREEVVSVVMYMLRWKIDVMRKQECVYCLEAGLSCRGTLVWCSVNGARRRNGERVALDRAELGWG